MMKLVMLGYECNYVEMTCVVSIKYNFGQGTKEIF